MTHDSFLPVSYAISGTARDNHFTALPVLARCRGTPGPLVAPIATLLMSLTWGVDPVFHAHVRLSGRTLAGLSPPPPPDAVYAIGVRLYTPPSFRCGGAHDTPPTPSPRPVSRVRIAGTVVAALPRPKYTRFAIDDGTAVTTVLVWEREAAVVGAGLPPPPWAAAWGLAGPAAGGGGGGGGAEAVAAISLGTAVVVWGRPRWERGVPGVTVVASRMRRLETVAEEVAATAETMECEVWLAGGGGLAG